MRDRRKANTFRPSRRAKRVAATWRMAVQFGGVKTGGLSLTSETSMLRMTVEDMAGEPLSKACTDREYRDTCRESSTIRMYQALGHVKGRLDRRRP